MKYCDMVDGKTYSCRYMDCNYTNWTREGIKLKFPWMMDMAIWKED